MRPRRRRPLRLHSFHEAPPATLASRLGAAQPVGTGAAQPVGVRPSRLQCGPCAAPPDGGRPSRRCLCEFPRLFMNFSRHFYPSQINISRHFCSDNGVTRERYQMWHLALSESMHAEMGRGGCRFESAGDCVDEIRFGGLLFAAFQPNFRLPSDQLGHRISAFRCRDSCTH